MEVVLATAISSSSDDSQEVQELDINRLYFDVVDGEKMTFRIKLLEEEVLHMRENQERILQQHLEAEVQQQVQHEVSHLRQQSDDRFKSMEERWFDERNGVIPTLI
ncbi:hypothetical protein H5410_001966 [Solanum commersonii]|uniref:Uncharacterized protein n=1 Tax=Solanum commersonii TaxID=4109 RepID=A0A9J6B0N7_SOLCO|nr:hypothetical protein H5410_001966 [Solanum commersonii]